MQPRRSDHSPLLTEPAWVRRLLIGIALGFAGICLVLPLVVVFGEAFRQGVTTFAKTFTDPVAGPMTRHAIGLTLMVTAVCMVINGAFGICAAWAITRFRFWGKSLLISLIDLPFAVSPVISGLIFILLFGAHGLLGHDTAIGAWLLRHDLQVVFAVPGILLATLFITFPFVARELIPLMQAQGSDEEEAARMMGASGWTMFWRITLPNITWGLLYGVILCSARALGEFGAVSVLSGHIQGQTNTLPLHIEILYNDNQSVAAFACASILALLAVVTLGIKRFVEWRMSRDRTPDPES
jgi:sulfate transport system permease protein